jgi:hypothetical protein
VATTRRSNRGDTLLKARVVLNGKDSDKPSRVALRRASAACPCTPLYAAPSRGHVISESLRRKEGGLELPDLGNRQLDPFAFKLWL